MMDQSSETYLFDDMSELFSNGAFSDLVIVCRDQEFKVHRAVLAPRCHYFRTHPDIEQPRMFRMQLDENLCALRLILQYLYTRDSKLVSRTFEEDTDLGLLDLAELCDTSGRFQVEGLLQQCSQYVGLESSHARFKSFYPRECLWIEDLFTALTEFHVPVLHSTLIRWLDMEGALTHLSDFGREALHGCPTLAVESLEYIASKNRPAIEYPTISHTPQLQLPPTSD